MKYSIHNQNSKPLHSAERISAMLILVNAIELLPFALNDNLSFNIDISQIVGYQILLQYLLRTLTEQPDNSFLDDVDKVNCHGHISATKDFLSMLLVIRGIETISIRQSTSITLGVQSSAI